MARCSLKRCLVLCVLLLSIVPMYIIMWQVGNYVLNDDPVQLLHHKDTAGHHYPVKIRGTVLNPESHLMHHNYTQNFEVAAACEQFTNISLSSWRRGVVTAILPSIEKNCKSLRRGNKQEYTRVKDALNRSKITRLENKRLHLEKYLRNCSLVQEDFLYNFYVSEEELEFPLAFSLVVSSHPFQVIRLLKTIYRPHNFYCIHPDGKAGKEFSKYFSILDFCLDNVFIPKKVYKVYYAHHSIMDAELSCMEELLERYPPPRWKYSINVCGTELPLKTNREMVWALKTLEGTCAINVYTKITGGYFYDERLKWELALNKSSERVYYTSVHLSQAPHSLKIYKGDHFVMLTPEFIRFILSDTRALDLRKWLQKVYAPEEEFFATLYMLSDAPGGGGRGSRVPKVDEYIWMFPGYPKRECNGIVARGVCVLSSGDLKLIYELGVQNFRPTFFFNKYYDSEDHVAMDCMEERLLNQNQVEYKRDCT